MDGSAFNRLPVDGIIWFSLFGMAVAALIALGLIAGLGYVLYLGVAALLA